MTKFFSGLVLLCCCVHILHAQAELSKSDMVKFDFKILAANKIKIRSNDASCINAYRQLIEDADKALEFKPVSVMQKTDLPPSGDKHDYMSIAPYFWPDSSKPGGLPYKNKDGEVNTEIKNYPDKINLGKLCENVYLLSLAYYFSDDDKYAEHASRLLRVWFLDKATNMNPNLNYGQAVKGITTGRAEGLIDTRHFIFFIDAIELLKNSKHWTAQDQTGIKNWFSSFLTWMQTSTIGQNELNASNNHGVWYDAQSLAIALFIDSIKLANHIIERAVDRLDKQMDDHGFFPLELARTTSLHYSVFILNAFTIIAQLSEKTDVRFLTITTASGKSFKKSFDAIMPFITKELQWAGREIRPFNYLDAFPILLRGSLWFNCNTCLDAIKNISNDKSDRLLLHLL
jgi:hypothetical protein